MISPDRTLRGRITTALKDLRFGGLLNGVAPSKFHEEGAHQVSSTPYHILPIIFGGMVRPDDVLVDIGCGKGRVINWWLSQYPTNPIHGIEIDPDVAMLTRKRLGRYPNVTISTGSASNCIPPDGTLFFLFNPFAEGMMRDFIEAVARLPAPKRIIYYFCIYKNLFANDPRFLVTEIPVPSGFHPTALIELTQNI